MSTVLERREGVAAEERPVDALEPKDEALAEIRAEVERVGRKAESLRRRLAEVEAGGAAVRRRRVRARGFVVADGTRIFGLDGAA